MAARPPPEEFSALLRAWLSTRYGGGVEDAEPPTCLSGGYDFWIYALRLAGESLPLPWTGPVIARVPPMPERFASLQQESRFQSWAAAGGFPAPRVVDLVAPGVVIESPVQMVDRVPGVTMADAITAAPWRMRRLMYLLGDLHARLHALPAPAWAVDAPELSVLERRTSLVRFVLERVAMPDLEAALAQVAALGPALAVASPVVCHGDFHPLNVLIDGADPYVIDWTDAGVGDPHCDVARTAWVFRFAAMAAGSRRERGVLRTVAPYLARTYLRSYARARPVDPRRLALWRPVHLLHAWAMLVADTHELTGPSRLGRGARLAHVVAGQFRSAVADVRQSG